MDDLIAKLEAAESGSRALDLMVMTQVGYTMESDPRDSVDGWRGPDGKLHYAYHNVTTSLDAALALSEMVLPGWRIDLSKAPTGGGWAEVAPETWAYYENASDVGGVEVGAATPALALTIAILRATGTKDPASEGGRDE